MDSQSEAALIHSYSYLLYKDIQQHMEEHRDEYVAYLEAQEKEESVHVKKERVTKG